MKQNSVPITYSRGLLLYGAVLLLVVPVRLLVAMVMSAAVHELFHIAMLVSLKIKINGIHVGLQGAKIYTEPMTDTQELLSAAAGPIGGFLLFLCYRWTPLISLCALVQSCYNLLPVYPADGGRILRCIAAMLCNGNTADRVVYWLEVLTLGVIVGVCVYGSLFLSLGIIPLFVGISFLMNGARRK